MKKIKAWLSIYAHAEFTAEIDTDGMSEDEIKEEFLNQCEPVANLCYQCARELETDSEYDHDWAEKNLSFTDLEIEDA